ncbi:MAG: sugar phosphate nucleotidyltransferase [bacterium]|nr:sugar phosphate nucleotidyltransferase [bacterium]
MKPAPRQAMVLAAGLGTRLRPLTHEIPKPALPVGGVPILMFNLFLLKQAGIKDILINLHHRPDNLKTLLRHSHSLGLKIQWSWEKSILGTAGGIAHALPKFRNSTLLILNGDVVTNVNIRKMWSRHHQKRAQATLAVIPPHYAPVKSYVEYESSGQIRAIAGRPSVSKLKKLNKGIFSGIQILERSMIDTFPKNKFGCIIRQIYQPALAKDANLLAFPHQGAWWDLGNLDSLKEMDLSLWQGNLPKDIHHTWKKVYAWSRPLFDNS